MAFTESESVLCPKCGKIFESHAALAGHLGWCGKDTTEHRVKISRAKTGRRLSAETRAKMSESHKGKKNPLYGRRGADNPNYGSKRTAETRRRMSEAQQGEKNHNYGKKLSAEQKQKISEALRGRNNPNYGRTGELSPLFGRRHTVETRAKISKSHMGLSAGENNPMFGKRGPKHPNWQGGISSERQRWYRNGGKAWVSHVWAYGHCALCKKRIPRDNDAWNSAHHIIPFVREEFRSEPANGLLLCAECHKNIHYGSGWYAWAALNEIHWEDAEAPLLFRDALAEWWLQFITPADRSTNDGIR
ncbi:MAG: NUMOD3 domain-containing DNA-binding protein [Candidatus Freyarchaeota archaeon]